MKRQPHGMPWEPWSSSPGGVRPAERAAGLAPCARAATGHPADTVAKFPIDLTRGRTANHVHLAPEPVTDTDHPPVTSRPPATRGRPPLPGDVPQA